MSAAQNLELQAATYKRQFSEANSRAKNLTFRHTALQSRFDKHVDYSIDLARIIESLSSGREIVVPQTLPNIHYGMAVEALALRQEMLAALRSADAFMSGFKGDESQDGIDEKLATIRAALAKAGA